MIHEYEYEYEKGHSDGALTNNNPKYIECQLIYSNIRMVGACVYRKRFERVYERR